MSKIKDKIGKTIHQQIVCGLTKSGHSGVIAMMCWGAHDFVAKERNDESGDLLDGLGSLHFKVIGSKFRGSVNVILHFNDTYKVIFTKDKKWKDPKNVVEEVDNVYFDQLTDVIDKRVELPVKDEMPVCP